MNNADFYINNAKVTKIILPQVKSHISPEGELYVPSYWFQGCTSIQSITIPEGISFINSYAFRLCTNLRLVSISSRVHSIGSSAFEGCISLQSVIIKRTTPPSITTDAFPSKNVHIIIPCGTSETYWQDTEWAKYPNYEEDVVFDWSVKSADETRGTTTIVQSPASCANPTTIIQATPAAGYLFEKWNDENTDNHRTVEITDNIVYTAHFISDDSVKYVSLDKNRITLYANETQQLTATIAPTTAENKNMTWSSTNPSVASVSATGLVTAHNGGTTTITITTEEGGFTASCEVIVIIPMTKLAFKQSHITLEIGDLDYLNTIVIPSNADRGTWNWSSNNKSIVSIANGLVTAHQVGTATITLKAINYALSATCEITVVDEGKNIEDGVVVNPADSSVTITWSAVEGAASYILVISADEAQTKKICTLTFDTHGRLTNLHFQRNKPSDTQEDNLLNFTITGLQPSTTYGYSMSSYDEKETLIASKVGHFTTTSYTGIEMPFMRVSNDVKKILENGTIYILRNGEKYTIDGIKVQSYRDL